MIIFYALFVCCILSVIQLCYINNINNINRENQHIISNNIESNSRDNLNNIEIIVNPDNTIYVGTAISS
tara:strand:- start:1396 stop:1602 length:207 start_codon:yes stop_codon:yes gene_type:complete